MCGNITKTIKNISRTHCNFLGIFARNFSMHRGSNSKKKVQLAKNSRKRQKAQGP